MPAGPDCACLLYDLGEGLIRKKTRWVAVTCKPSPRDMNTLFENAVSAMQLGVRDYQANNPCRAVFAVQNLYSGILLLAQEVLVRKAPKATPEQLFGVRYKPVPDGRGGVKHVSASNRTVDLADIGQRFRDFGLAIDCGALRELNRIRADIECHSADDELRETCGKPSPRRFR